MAAHACTAPVSACLVVVADATGVGGKDRGGERLSQCRDEAVWQWRPWQDRPRTRVAQARHKHQPALLLCIGQNADFRSCSFEVCVFIIKHISSSDIHGCCHWGAPQCPPQAQIPTGCFHTYKKYCISPILPVLQLSMRIVGSVQSAVEEPHRAPPMQRKCRHHPCL